MVCRDESVQSDLEGQQAFAVGVGGLTVCRMVPVAAAEAIITTATLVWAGRGSRSVRCGRAIWRARARARAVARA